MLRRMPTPDAPLPATTDYAVLSALGTRVAWVALVPITVDIDDAQATLQHYAGGAASAAASASASKPRAAAAKVRRRSSKSV